MKPLYILKIGGSVATLKDKPGVSVRSDLLKKIASSIQKAKEEKDFDLILIHGAGAAGHQLAKEYGLRSGTNGEKRKFDGALLSCIANQRLDNAIFEIFASCGLRVFPVHTASTIIQKNKKIAYCDTKIIEGSIKRNCSPILYGEMVFDQDVEMSVCSGDAIASFLAKELGAEKILFASDIDGIFDRDPHLHEDAQLIEIVSLKDILDGKEVEITESHNVDVTGGLWGKVRSLDLKHGKSLKSVEIFNGLYEKNYTDILLEKDFPHTKIEIKEAVQD